MAGNPASAERHSNQSNAVGQCTTWEVIRCDEWRARTLLDITGLHAAPYVSDCDELNVLPPTYLISQSLGMGELGIPDAPVRLNGGNTCRWEVPLIPGDQVERQTTINEVVEKQGSSGRLVLYKLETRYRRAGSSELVAHSWNTAIRRYPRASDPSGGSNDKVEGGSPMRPSISGRKLNPEPKLNGALAILEVTPSSRDLVRYAGATDDWYEAHYDFEFAQRSGLPGVIVHGLLKLGWLASAAARFVGNGSFVREISAEYRGIDLVNEPFTVWYQPSEDDGGAPHDTGITRLRLYGVSANGTISTGGTAVVEKLT
jgi:3-methylfumaryl-CoA hydratase